MTKTRPAATISLLNRHLINQLEDYERSLPALGLRDKVIRSIELLNAVHKLGIALTIEAENSRPSAKDRIRSYLSAYPNEVIEGVELEAVSGISE